MSGGSAGRFRGDLDDLVEITGMSVDELEGRDVFFGGVDRWCSVEGGRIVGCLSVHMRPDDRSFIRFDGDDATLEQLVDVAVSELDRSLYVTADDASRAARLRTAGFTVADVLDVFEVSFAHLEARVRGAIVPSNVEIIDAEEADRDALYALDVRLRNEVPGTDGWRGNRTWFDGEFDERPPYDPTAYLVAHDTAAGEYVGLTRFWRNESGPRLGLIGIVPRWRRTRLAAALLRPAAEAAASWGSETFVTETSRSNRAVHPFLERLASARTGSVTVMARHPQEH